MKLSPFKRKTLSSLLLPLFIMALFAWTGCEKDYNYVVPAKTTPTGGGGGGGNTTTVSFATDIQSIFNASCNMAGCHNGGGADPDLSIGNAYGSIITFSLVNTEAPASSELYRRVTLPSSDTQFMPDGGTPLSSTQTAKILTWITEGAKNN